MKRKRYFSKSDIILWAAASIENPRCVSVTVCFAIFLVNDIYGYISWRKMKEKQQRLYFDSNT